MGRHEGWYHGESPQRDCGEQAMNHPPSGDAPASPPRVRVEGVLDVVRASDGTFLLRLADGRSIPGRLVGPRIASLAGVIGRLLLVFGTGQFGPSGELERIEADGFIPNDGQLWTVSPDDLPFSEDVEKERAQRLAATIGTWPGDETDEQIEQALREIS
jgi:hypothetical protein